MAAIPRKDEDGHHGDQGKRFRCELEVTFAKQEWATVVYNALNVDAELNLDKVSRELSVNGGGLRVTWHAAEAKLLKAAFGSFMDILDLATRTVEQFQPPTLSYKHEVVVT